MGRRLGLGWMGMGWLGLGPRLGWLGMALLGLGCLLESLLGLVSLRILGSKKQNCHLERSRRILPAHPAQYNVID